MFKTIVKFIGERKFSFPTMAIIISVAFIAVASALAANEDVKKIIGEEIVEKSGVDNTVLLAADLENFDLKMEITNALEDEENYYVDYQYKTLAIKDNVWQEVLKLEQIIVSKAALAGEDLGLYLMEELGEIIDYQLAFLMEVQEKEEEKGVTVVLEKTEYTGLIGLVFNTKTKELPGYEPVVKPSVAEVNDAPQDDSIQSMEPADKGPASDENYDDYTGVPEENNYPDDAPVWDQLEKNCLDSGRFWDWDSKTCNDEEVVNDEEESEEYLENEEDQEEDQEEDLGDEGELAEEPVANEEPTESADEDPTEDEPAEEPVADEEPVEEPADELEQEIEDLGNEDDQGDEEDLI